MIFSFDRFSPVFLSCQRSITNFPVMQIPEPLKKYCEMLSARLPKNSQSMKTGSSILSPFCPFLTFESAKPSEQIAVPEGVYFVSGSRVRRQFSVTEIMI